MCFLDTSKNFRKKFIINQSAASNHIRAAFQFKHLHTVYFPTINMKAECGPEGVPTLLSTGPGVDIQQIFRLIIHHFQYVRMTADEYVGVILPD